MIFSAEQKFLLDTLRDFKCIRQSQLQTLAARRFRIPERPSVNEHHIAAMLRQLRYGNWDVQAKDGYVYLDNALPEPRLLEAIDIMLELTDTTLKEFKTRTSPPLLLRFIVDRERLRFFTVAHLSREEDIVLLERGRVGRIIWITDDGCMPEGLTLPPKHFFAARQEDGSHRFYGSTTEP